MMIKFMMEREGRQILGMIIVKGNLDYLLNDMPIHFSAEQMGKKVIAVQDVFLAYFETQDEAMNWFKDNNLIDERTIVHNTDKENKPQ